MARSLDILGAEGESKIRVDALVRKLGVTKGSFYWHFANRDDFLVQLIEYWAEKTTQPVVQRIGKLGTPATERLLAVMEDIEAASLSRYDLPIRALVTHDPHLRPVVRKVDVRRFNFCRSLFKEMGFRGDELTMRTKLFTVYHCLEQGHLVHTSAAERKRLLKTRHAFFIRK